MPEENEDKPTESSSESSSESAPATLNFTESNTDIVPKLAQIQELEGKIRLLRWGLFVGVLAILSFGILGLYKVSMKAAQPSIDIFDEAKAIFLENNQTIQHLGKSLSAEFDRTSTSISTVEDFYTELQTDVDEASDNARRVYEFYGEMETEVNTAADNASKIYNKFEKMGPEVNTALSNAGIVYDQYIEVSEDANRAYGTVSGLMDPNGPTRKQLKKELQEAMDEEIKPAAEDLAKTVLIDVQDEVFDKFDEISAHSDEFMSIAYEEYDKLTNNIPNAVNDALEQTLLKMITKREVKMHKMFPKLTKEKQTEVVSRLANFSEEESEKIFIALFADHLSELGELGDSLQEIYTKEGGARANNKNDVTTTLTLLSTLIEIAMKNLDTKDHWEGAKKNPKDKPAPPKKEKANPKDKPANPKKEKANPKDKPASPKNK